jgi:hypothetical protein
MKNGYEMKHVQEIEDKGHGAVYAAPEKNERK